MKRVVLIGLCFLPLLSGCSPASRTPEPEVDVAIKDAFFDFTLDVTKARAIQRKCPDLSLSFNGMMAELRARPNLARSHGLVKESDIDMNKLVAEVDRFEKSSGLDGATREQYCAFGSQQMDAKTVIGRMLEKKKS